MSSSDDKTLESIDRLLLDHSPQIFALDDDDSDGKTSMLVLIATLSKIDPKMKKLDLFEAILKTKVDIEAILKDDSFMVTSKPSDLISRMRGLGLIATLSKIDPKMKDDSDSFTVPSQPSDLISRMRGLELIVTLPKAYPKMKSDCLEMICKDTSDSLMVTLTQSDSISSMRGLGLGYQKSPLPDAIKKKTNRELKKLGRDRRVQDAKKTRPLRQPQVRRQRWGSKNRKDDA